MSVVENLEEGYREKLDHFCKAVFTEVLRARELFPSPNLNALAMVEEVGEVAKALIEGESSDALGKECIQVAAMAARVAIEGDPSVIDGMVERAIQDHP